MEKEYIIINENVISSWLKDIVTFGSMFFMLLANRLWLGDRTITVVFILVIIFLWAFGRSGVSKSIHRFNSVKEAKEYINKL